MTRQEVITDKADAVRSFVIAQKGLLEHVRAARQHGNGTQILADVNVAYHMLRKK